MLTERDCSTLRWAAHLEADTELHGICPEPGAGSASHFRRLERLGLLKFMTMTDLIDGERCPERPRPLYCLTAAGHAAIKAGAR